MEGLPPGSAPAPGSRASMGDAPMCVCPAPGTQETSGAWGASLGAGCSVQALPRPAPLCRPAAHEALSGLRARRWIDHSTRAVSVHFTLYNPPTRLLSSVSLHAELLPAGDLALSPLVQSLAVFRSDSALWSSPMLPEVGPPAPPLHTDPRAPLRPAPHLHPDRRDAEPGTQHHQPLSVLTRTSAQASTAPQGDGAAS